MYRSCIFCSADLGANDLIEWFPVGRVLAFDAWKGRLWAVCPRCGRWNLAPIEERWEAVEQADRLFRDTHLRVQSENIGLAKMLDGSRLVRVGRALPGELAAWRYGKVLRRRRQAFWLQTGFAAAASLSTGIPFLPGVRLRKEVVLVVDADASPVDGSLQIHRRNLGGTEFYVDDGRLHASLPRRRRLLRSVPAFEMVGRDARVLLERTITVVNQSGASQKTLRGALDLLSLEPMAEAYVSRLGIARPPGANPARLRITEWARSGYWRCYQVSSGQAPVRLRSPRLLALEMALHDDLERRALEGELADLEARWQEAEAIAQIADSL